MYIEGMVAFFIHAQKNNFDFQFEIFEKFNSNQYVKLYLKNNTLLKSSAILEIHKNELRNITEKYIR
jgi:hypothetical protein